MLIKKIIQCSIFAIISLSYAAFAAEEYVFKINIKGIQGETQSLPPFITEWVNKGNVGDCTEWEPDPDTVDYGSVFQQSRSCQQEQTRQVQTKVKIVATGEEVVVSSLEEQRYVYVTQEQDALGSKQNWQFLDASYTDWENKGQPSFIGNWSPAAALQEESFIQSKSGTQTQSRFKQEREMDTFTFQIRNKGEPIEETQFIDITAEREVTVAVGEWANAGNPLNCSAWLPITAHEDDGVAFVQNQICDQSQTRTVTYTAEGTQVHSRTETQMIQVANTQDAVGTGKKTESWVAHTPVYSDWVNAGDPSNMGSWTPAVTVQTSNFYQTRNYDQNQTRTRQERQLDQFSGRVKNVGFPLDEYRAVKLSNNRYVTVTWSAWAEFSTKSCSEWGALSVSTVNAAFKKRTCSQEVVRNRLYHAGSTLIAQVEEKKTNNFEETQVLDVVYTPWADYGETSCTAWPVIDTSVLNDKTQTRDCVKNQIRQRQYKLGTNIAKAITETQTRTWQESRTITVAWTDWLDFGEKVCQNYPEIDKTAVTDKVIARSCVMNQDRKRVYSLGTTMLYEIREFKQRSFEESRPVLVTWTPLVNNGVKNCSTDFLPLADAQLVDFEQTRTCLQPQVTVRQYRFDVPTAGVHYQESEYSNVTLPESRTVVVTWSPWLSSNEIICDAFTPAPAAQTENFDQTRNCTRKELSNRLYHVDTTLLKTVADTRIVSYVDTRPIAVTYTPWIDSNNLTCGAWTPDAVAQTEEFTQTKACTKNQVRTRVYSTGVTSLNEFSETQAVASEQSRLITRVESAWLALTGTLKSCTAWTPKPEEKATGEAFTQTRDCLKDESRTVSFMDGSVLVKSLTENREVPVTQTNAATGTGGVATNWVAHTPVYSAWSTAVKSNYTDWTPAPANQTAQFVQTRTFTSTSTRTRQDTERNTITAVIRNIGTPVTETSVTTPTETRYVVPHFSAYSNTSTPVCTEFMPLATNQTANYFVQTKNCSVNRKRTVTFNAYTGSNSTGTYLGVASTYTESSVYTYSESRYMVITASGYSNTSASVCDDYLPHAANQTANYYVQTRSCSVSQKRTWSYDAYTNITYTSSNGGYYYGSGAYLGNIHKRDETRVYTWSETRYVVINASGFSNTSATVCSEFTPAATNQTANYYVQTRSCSVSQKRTWSYDAYTNITYTSSNGGYYYGSGAYLGNIHKRDETRVYTWSETRYVVINASGFSNTSETVCPEFTPAATNQTANYYVQTRSCSVSQKRTWSYDAYTNITYTSSNGGYYYGSGTYLGNLNKREETRTTTWTEQRYVVISASGYTNMGESQCTEFLPLPKNQTTYFIQNRTCITAQKRTWSYDAHSNITYTSSNGGYYYGSGAYLGNIGKRDETTESSVNQNRYIAAYASAYTNLATPLCSDWSPAILDQTANFGQARSCDVPQERTLTYYHCSGISNNQCSGTNFGLIATTKEPRSHTYAENRAIQISYSAYGAFTPTVCDNWTPTALNQTASFTQTRNCSKQQTRTKYFFYMVGSTRYDVSNIPNKNIVNTPESRTVTLTTGNWVNSGDPFECTPWTPEASTMPLGEEFTQERSCSQAQTRIRTYSSGEQYSDTQTATVNESQTVTGSL